LPKPSILLQFGLFVGALLLG